MLQRPTRLRPTGLCIILFLCASAWGTANAQSVRPAPPAIKQLSIAAWAVSLQTDESTSRSTTTSSSSWRNTFGRERKTARWRKLGKRSIDADIVVLTQLKSIKEIRRLFPARTHQLIASRAALAKANRRLELVAGNDIEPALITYDSFPAIAVRRRRGLRVTALRHLTIKTSPDRDVGEKLRPQQHVALAVRMRVSGRHLWVMAPIKNIRCHRPKQLETKQSSSAPTCPTAGQARERIQQWLSQIGQNQTAILIAKASTNDASPSSASPSSASKDKPDTADTTSEENPACKHAARPRIEPAVALQGTRITLSEQQSAADRPCATLATLKFPD